MSNWLKAFEESVHESFEYLNRAGFVSGSVEGSSQVARIRYWKDNVLEVIVSMCPMRLEYDVDVYHREFGMANLYELELMSTELQLPKYQYGVYEAYLDKAKISSFISTLASRFRIVGLPLITGERSWSTIMNWKVDQVTMKKMEELSIFISHAFKESRWGDVVKAAQQMGNHAKEIDLKRLKYAQKRLSSCKYQLE